VSAYEQPLHDLMVRGLRGDDSAYRQFLDSLSGLFRAFFRRKLRFRDLAQAEDLVQETLLAIHLYRHSYDPGRPITAWVYAIARYKLVDHFRRSPGSRDFVPVDGVDALFSEDARDAVDPAHDVGALLEHLPSKQRTAIRLVKLEDLTAKEAARRMGISEADVKISIHRGLKNLMAFVAKGDTP
jgi:RNA polymerase sigma-70 factor (ECF subfamily)